MRLMAKVQVRTVTFASIRETASQYKRQVLQFDGGHQ
jgi:hypothetical protein